MYSVMLATVITAGSVAPAWGCHGCHGGGYNAFSSCSGCGGGCYGSCYGSCSGCYGGHHYTFSFGSCHGSCYGSYYGGTYNPYQSSCYGCTGCQGYLPSSCYGCWGGHSGYNPAVPQGQERKAIILREGEMKFELRNQDGKVIIIRESEEKKENKKEERREEKESQANPSSETPATARITVRLPEDAVLRIDNVECTLTSATRTFETPKLEPGQQYFYTLKVEVVRNGERIEKSRKVIFQGGNQVTVDFGDMTAAVSAKR
jgi:uncharacterized protein (TIGR03000 family)